MEPMIRGYIVLHTGRHMIEDAYLKPRLPPNIVRTIEQNNQAFKPTDWRPRTEAIALWRTVSEVYDHNEPEVYAALKRCGESVAAFASNTFLKLLMKILTPRMFAKKFPDMFARDHQFGRIEVESIDDHGMVAWFKDIGGYDYFGPFAHGWGGSGLAALGVKDLVLRIEPWSLKDLAPNDMKCVATWR